MHNYFRLELYFKDNRSFLIVFPDKKRRRDISDKLEGARATRTLPASRSLSILYRTPLIGRAASKAMTGSRDELATATRKWQVREISNVRHLNLVRNGMLITCFQFSYICVLNQISGRTPGDATQYPFFRLYSALFVVKDALFTETCG